MTQVKYVGKKQSEAAFSDETDIIWTPGSSHPIADEGLARRMLRHPDVFAIDETPPAASNAPGLGDATPKDATVLPEWVTDGISLGMTDEELQTIAASGGPDSDEGKPLYKAALHAVAKKRGLELHPNTGPDKVIEALKADVK